MYQVLTIFFLKGKKQNCLSLFVSCFFFLQWEREKSKGRGLLCRITAADEQTVLCRNHIKAEHSSEQGF